MHGNGSVYSLLNGRSRSLFKLDERSSLDEDGRGRTKRVESRETRSDFLFSVAGVRRRRRGGRGREAKVAHSSLHLSCFAFLFLQPEAKSDILLGSTWRVVELGIDRRGRRGGRGREGGSARPGRVRRRREGRSFIVVEFVKLKEGRVRVVASSTRLTAVRRRRCGEVLGVGQVLFGSLNAGERGRRRKGRGRERLTVGGPWW